MKESVQKCFRKARILGTELAVVFGEMENGHFFDCGISLSQYLLDQAVLGAACSVEDYTCGYINIHVCVGMRDNNLEKTFILSTQKFQGCTEDSEEIGDEEMEGDCYQ